MGIRERIRQEVNEHKEKLKPENNLAVVLHTHWDLRNSGSYYVWVLPVTKDAIFVNPKNSIKKYTLVRSVFDEIDNGPKEGFKRGELVVRGPFGLYTPIQEDLEKLGVNLELMGQNFKKLLEENNHQIDIYE